MPVDITKPKVIRSLLEAYEKENRLRSRWIETHLEEIKEAATLKREPTNYFETDVIVNNMVGGLAALSREHINAANIRRKIPLRDAKFIPGVRDLKHGHSLVDIELGDPKVDPRLKRPDTDETLDPLMRPIDPKTKRIIHKGIPENGRLKYLDVRNHIWPEKKYYFPECSNWDYGWRIKDSKVATRATHGRIWHLTRALRDNRVGPQPDPNHYKQPEVPGHSKCEN